MNEFDTKKNYVVFSSMMPKGVEHYGEKYFAELVSEVFSSMMPKGVEHTTTAWAGSSSATVFSSMMPKGVEHVLVLGVLALLTSVFVYDAERR